MSFKCENCNKTSKPGEKATRIVVTTREVIHPARPDAEDPGGKGTQIVKEKMICIRCKE